MFSHFFGARVRHRERGPPLSLPEPLARWRDGDGRCVAGQDLNKDLVKVRSGDDACAEQSHATAACRA